jgi:hypothetical protein
MPTRTVLIIGTRAVGLSSQSMASVFDANGEKLFANGSGGAPNDEQLMVVASDELLVSGGCLRRFGPN